ncbi:MAG: aminoacetone oxidase family FAD-binding enzyme [Parcubacteria group bacterium CG07_land_8_20_14_0_80_35_11]|nr:MAG: aminoacetone oxidase family FAD-binding enzyme [Parcubacteria group bacterium CG07_land_8_20_14_0_80_35_11]
MIKKENNFNVAVVGAGPAGMIAAGRAAELGAKVILVEKNKKPGRKLLLTGKGRCNITNAEFNLRKLVENYGGKGRFLFHAFSAFGPRDVIAFFEKLGLKTKTERGKRVFPFSDKSEDVLKTLIKYLVKNKANIVYDSEIIGVNYQNHKIKKLILKDGEIKATNYIFCTGGKSYPLTGSTGDGFRWAKDLGHHIKELSPALVPIKTKESWVKELQGLSLKNVEISIFQKGKKKSSEFGECLFTHFGLSGPIILDISKKVGEFLRNGEVKISLDLKPALDFAKLDGRVQRDFKKYQNKSFKNCLTDLLPHKLIPIIVKFSNIDPEKKANSITREERHNLVKLLKNLEMTAGGLLGFDSAIVTSGGIYLEEIDDKTMKSKIINNLFFAGEIIDIDGPSGGFNLQNCWSTGHLAGENAAK